VDVARDLESAFEELLSGQLNNAEVNS
jgi:hypothetical protein